MIVGYILLLFTPLLFIFMQGPSVSAELALGTMLALGGLFVTRQMRELRRGIPYLCALAVYIVLALYWADPVNDLSAKYTLGLICYLFTAGLMLREFIVRGKGSSVLLAVTLFFLCLAIVGVIVLRTVGAENLVKSLGLELSRANIENTSFTYLKFFKISNVIVGMSVFGVCPLAGIVVLFLDAPIRAKIIGALAFAIALYVNIQVLTRGALVASALGVFCLVPWIVFKLAPRRIFAYSMIGLLVLSGLAVVGVSRKGEMQGKMQSLIQRISETGNDTRLVHWHEAIGIIGRNPLGGGRRFMQTHTWAHNLFLDAALSTGIPGGLAFALGVSLIFFRAGGTLLRGGRGLPSGYIVLAAQLVTVFVFCMTAPPSLPIFGMLMLCAGFFARPYEKNDSEMENRPT